MTMKYRVKAILSDTAIEVEPFWIWAKTTGTKVIDRTAVNYGRPHFHTIGDEVELILPEYILDSHLVCVPFNQNL